MDADTLVGVGFLVTTAVGFLALVRALAERRRLAPPSSGPVPYRRPVNYEAAAERHHKERMESDRQKRAGSRREPQGWPGQFQAYNGVTKRWESV